MSAVYLPAFFVSLIDLLEDYYKFDAIPDTGHIQVHKTTVKISYPLATAYFLSFLLRIRKQVPAVKMAPSKGRSHDERFMGDASIDDLLTPEQIFTSLLFEQRSSKVIQDMRKTQNIYPVFEKRCAVLQCNSDCIEMDIAAVDTILTNSILYSKMGELICFQYLSKLSSNSDLTPQLEDYFLRGDGRNPFSQTAKEFVIEYQENRCFYCGQVLDNKNTDKKPRADHFIPWVFIKSSNIENLVYACNNCNSNKSNRLPTTSIFNNLLQRNVPKSKFWRKYPEEITKLDERIDRWIRNYYQASEQLSTGWKPDFIA
ncbi:MAG: HNH endonuclease [Clostridiales bacterium]|nr:HNH endonuclease [Clostridiales bacterium]MCF8023310.1 HNH endonuclease [Clostridiales bacterium]